jgi:urea transporter
MEHEETCLTLAAVLPNWLIVHDSFGFRHMPGNSTAAQEWQLCLTYAWQWSDICQESLLTMKWLKINTK